MKTHWKKLQNPDFLGAYSLDSGDGKYTDIVAAIASVKVEDIIGADGKHEDCMVARFTGDVKPMIINVTNAKTLERLLKTPYIEDWAGRKIQIGVESVKAFGDVVDALRVRKFLPKEAGPQICVKCGAEVSAAGNLTAAQVVAFSINRKGAIWCAACMKGEQTVETE